MSQLLKKGDLVFIKEKPPAVSIGSELWELLEVERDFVKIQTTRYYRDTQYNPPVLREWPEKDFSRYHLKILVVPLVSISSFSHYSLEAAAYATDKRRKQPEAVEASCLVCGEKAEVPIKVGRDILGWLCPEHSKEEHKAQVVEFLTKSPQNEQKRPIFAGIDNGPNPEEDKA